MTSLTYFIMRHGFKQSRTEELRIHLDDLSEGNIFE